MNRPETSLEYLWFTVLASIVFVLGLCGILVSATSYSLPGLLRPSYIVVLFAVLGSVYIHRKYLAWGYEMREDHLYLKHGVFKKVETMVPFVRIQHVDTQRNVLERIFGISRVVVYTAGSRGSDVTVKGLLPEDAVEMQEKLRDVAIESEDRDAV